MRILFLQSLTYPFIGIMSISAVLRRSGHDTKLYFLDFNRPSQADFDQIKDYEPGLIALPVYTGWQQNVLRFCRKLKEKLGIGILLGGPHPTHCPDIIEDDAVDYICIGEGEVSCLELVNRLEAGKPVDQIPGIWLKKEGRIISTGVSPLADLQDLPSMDIDLYCEASEAIRRQENREFSLNRGCPFNCTYCNAPSLRSLYGKAVLRSRPVDKALEEIHYVFEKYPFKSVYFTSDNFFLSKDYAIAFLERFKRDIGVPFYCQMRVELIDREIARILRESGCFMVGVGLESGSPRVRKEILGRTMSNEALIRGCRHLQDQGIMINAYNMIGIPGETFEETMETLRLNIKINPSTSWASLFQPYPGTKIGMQMLEQGLITRKIFDVIPASYFDKSVILGETAHLWTNLQRLFQFAVLHPRLATYIPTFCRVKIPRIYDIFFIWSFYRYVCLAYKIKPLKSFTKVFRNAFEALKADSH